MTGVTLRIGIGLAIASWLTLVQPALAQQLGGASLLTEAHLTEINRLFKANGISNGWVVRDRLGRVELQGVFEDERAVDQAFSLAQTVIGVRSVSPVTPAQIKVKAWEECLSRLLSGDRCGSTGFSVSTPARGNETPPGPVADKYALVVGVGQFKNQIQPLQYASKDASDLYTYLVDPAGGNFKRQNVILLRNENATRETVTRALTEIQRRAQEDDLVILYFSSHGTPPDKFGGVHVVTYDSEVKPREKIWETSLTEGILRDFVQTVRAKRLIVVMDACYSNGAYGQIAGFLPQGGKSLDGGPDEGYGRSQRYMAQRLLGAKDLVVDEPAVRGPGTGSKEGSTGWGKVLISASDGGERSWESDQLRNSVFTRFFIDGLRRSGGAVKPAFEYAKPAVKQQVKREKGMDIEQNPQLTPNRRDWNISLAVPSR